MPGAARGPGLRSPIVAAGRAGFLRTNVGIAAGTAMSRLTGYGRVLALGYLMQTTAREGDPGSQLASAYYLANNMPNIVYDLVLGGILSATLVPLFTNCFRDEDDDAVSALVTTSVVALGALTVVATVAAPLIIDAYTSVRVDPSVDADRYRAVATTLAYWFLPQIFFYGLTSIATALLHARRMFFAAAWAPVLNNVVVIAVLVGARTLIDGQPSLETLQTDATFRFAVGFGTSAGVAAMAVVLLPSLLRARLRLSWRLDWGHVAVRRMLTLSGWTAGYVVANQIAFAIVTVLAQRDTAGFSAYNTMYIFFQLPYGLLAVTVMTTLSPELADDVARADWSRFRSRIRHGIWLITLTTAPAAVLFVTAPEPVANLAGSLGRLEDAPEVLAAFSVGLVGFSLYLFFMRGFYAMQNTKTPFVINAIENLLNVVLGIVLVVRFGVIGLALAFALAYVISAALAYWSLANWSRGLGGGVLVPRLTRLAAAALASGVAVWAVRDRVGDDSGAGLFVRLAVCGLVCLGVYLAVVVATRAGQAVPAAGAARPAPRPPVRGAPRDRRGG